MGSQVSVKQYGRPPGTRLQRGVHTEPPSAGRQAPSWHGDVSGNVSGTRHTSQADPASLATGMQPPLSPFGSSGMHTVSGAGQVSRSMEHGMPGLQIS